MSSSQGGAVIRVGSRVSALVGELGYWNGEPQKDATGKKQKRFKQRYYGTVVESKCGRNWLVRWDRSGAGSEKEYSTFKLKYEGPGTLRATNQEAAQRLQAQQGVAAPSVDTVQAAAAPQQGATAAPVDTDAVPQQATAAPVNAAQANAAPQPPQAAAPPAVETVEEESVEEQAAAEGANARTVDPDTLEEQDDRFDVANDFDLYNLDDIAEYDGDRHARKWRSYEIHKRALFDDEVSVGTGARRITWKVRLDIKASDVDPVAAAEFPDIGVCDFDFAIQMRCSLGIRGFQVSKRRVSCGIGSSVVTPGY